MAARVDGDGFCEVVDGWLVLQTSVAHLASALYKGCSGGPDTSIGTPYDCPYEQVRSYGTSSFAQAPLPHLPLHLLYLQFTSFHVLV